jgi:hypothetical protein
VLADAVAHVEPVGIGRLGYWKMRKRISGSAV